METSGCTNTTKIENPQEPKQKQKRKRKKLLKRIDQILKKTHKSEEE